MTTTLGAHGEIGIPAELREADHLDAGDRFEIERVLPGRYLLARILDDRGLFSIGIGGDGLPVIRGQGAVITSAVVREIDGLAR